MASFDLPYFDQIISALERQHDTALATAFARHVHWGCYDDPNSTDTSIDGYVTAAETMTNRICDAGQVADRQSILDVGCGFGGTVAHLNERLENVDLIGLNIDPRQLDRARQLVTAAPTNTVTFIEGDACDLPYNDGEFDTVLAVECIFHFRSRKQFLRQAARVLKPGGHLALSDFVLREGSLADLTRWMARDGQPNDDFYGSNAKPITSAAYAKVASALGLRPLVDDDITAHTAPTYAAMRRIYAASGIVDGESATDYLQGMATNGFVQYHVLAFERLDRTT